MWVVGCLTSDPLLRGVWGAECGAWTVKRSAGLVEIELCSLYIYHALDCIGLLSYGQSRPRLDINECIVAFVYIQWRNLDAHVKKRMD
jgi:hypothetical protein